MAHLAHTRTPRPPTGRPPLWLTRPIPTPVPRRAAPPDVVPRLAPATPAEVPRRSPKCTFVAVRVPRRASMPLLTVGRRPLAAGGDTRPPEAAGRGVRRPDDASDGRGPAEDRPTMDGRLAVDGRGPADEGRAAPPWPALPPAWRPRISTSPAAAACRPAGVHGKSAARGTRVVVDGARDLSDAADASPRSARPPPVEGAESAEKKRASRRRGRFVGARLAVPGADAGRGCTGGTSLTGPNLGDDGGDDAAVTVEPTDGERDVRVPTNGLPTRLPPSWKPGGGAGRSPEAAAPESRKAGSADGSPDPPPSLVRENRDAVGAPARGAAGARQPGGAPDRATGERTLYVVSGGAEAAGMAATEEERARNNGSVGGGFDPTSGLPTPSRLVHRACATAGSDPSLAVTAPVQAERTTRQTRVEDGPVGLELLQ